MSRPRRPNRLIASKPAGPDHRVITVTGGTVGYRRQPCATCPWRQDATGVFPAEAFRHSAGTAYDMASNTFACHASGQAKAAVCAGFLLRGAEHNLAARMRWGAGEWHEGLTDGGHALHRDYRAMAEANGVAPDDPVLAPCRDMPEAAE